MKTDSDLGKKEAAEHSTVNGQTPLHVISLGAGVQSSAMALMACQGLIKPMPQVAIFADTGDEPLEVYEWLKELTRMLTFPVVWLKGEKLSEAIVNKWDFSQIPAWFQNQNGKPSIGRRQCTRHFKIVPIRREIRHRFPNQNCTLWQGISLDEAHRMKPSNRQWLTHRWPLIEQRLTRRDCLKYLKEWTSWEIPKSACVYCPYRSDEQWRASLAKPHDLEIIRRVEAVLLPRREFLHRSLSSVEAVDFTKHDEEELQFGNECEGMCGT